MSGKLVLPLTDEPGVRATHDGFALAAARRAYVRTAGVLGRARRCRSVQGADLGRQSVPHQAVLEDEDVAPLERLYGKKPRLALSKRPAAKEMRACGLSACADTSLRATVATAWASAAPAAAFPEMQSQVREDTELDSYLVDWPGGGTDRAGGRDAGKGRAGPRWRPPVDR